MGLEEIFQERLNNQGKGKYTLRALCIRHHAKISNGYYQS